MTEKLKAKAKTIEELEKEFLLKIDGYSGSAEMQSATKEFREQKLVKVEDAEAEIQQLKKELKHTEEVRDNHWKAWHETLELMWKYKEQVEAAKTILKKICADCGEKDYPPNACEMDCNIYELKRILTGETTE